MNWITCVGRFAAIGAVLTVCVVSSYGSDRPDTWSSLPLPWERSAAGAANTPVVVMVELEVPPSAVVYARELGRSRNPRNKAMASASAREQLALIEGQQLDLVAELESGTVGAEVLYRLQRVFNGIAVRVEPSSLAAIADLPGVLAVHPVAPVRLANNVSVPFLGAPKAWTNPPGVTGAGVSVGVIDTGIDYMHLDFLGSGSADDYAANDPSTIDDGFFPTAKVIGGWDFGDDDPDPTDCLGSDFYKHGTHVAGTIAGVGVNSDRTHFTGPYDETTPFDELDPGPGMAPDAKLYALRVIGDSSKAFEDPFALITTAVEWSVDPNGDGDFEDHLDVINMSLGGIYGVTGQWLSDVCNNAALVGVVPVGAACNDGDGFFLTCRPGAAIRSISVAAIRDRVRKTIGPVRVNTPAELAGDLYAEWQRFGPYPSGAGVTADVVQPQPPDACRQINNPADVAGRIVLVDWLGCAIDVKAAFAEAAGALGVIVEPTGWSQLPIAFPGGNRVAIPVAMIGAADGAALRAALPEVNVTMKIEPADVDLADVTMDFTSRGPRVPDSLLKPDLAAPGGVRSASADSPVGSNQGVYFEGTSMAAPHVAGAVALLKQLHPDWTVEELKALLMNTAVDVFGGPGTGSFESIDRVGAGRIDVERAIAAEVIAMAAEPDGLVSVSFGFVEVADTVELSKMVEVVNRGGETIVFDIGIELRSDLPGATLLPSAPQIVVPPGATATLTVDLSATGSQLRDLCDPGASRNVPLKTPFGPVLASGEKVLSRQCLNEEAGYLELTPRPPRDDHPVLRVPIHAALRPVSSMAAIEDRLVVTDDETEHQLHLEGGHLDSGSSAPGFRSLVSAFELAEISPEDPLITDEYRSFDLGPIGVTSDYDARQAAGQTFEETVVSFAIVTRAPSAHPAPVHTEVWIDRERDGVFDVFFEKITLIHWNTEIADLTGLNDVYWTYTHDLHTEEIRWQYPVNALPATEVKAGLLNSDAFVLSVRAADLGLTEGASSFNYEVRTTGAYPSSPTDRSEVHTFDAARPGLHLTGDRTLPMFWGDLHGAVIPVRGDRRAFVANGSQGMLLIHHHNANGRRAQVIEITTEVSEGPREGGGRVTP